MYDLKSKYDAEFDKQVYVNSQSFSFPDYLKLDLKTFNQKCKDKCSILLTYQSKDEFLNYAKYFGIMDDFKVCVLLFQFIQSGFFFLKKSCLLL